MSRFLKIFSRQPAVLTIAVMSLLGLVALWTSGSPDRAGGSLLFSQTASAAEPPSVLLGDWPTPQAVLVLTGDQHGYMEPCGCSERQSGGFARRADLLRQLIEVRGWPTAAIDVGGVLDARRVNYPQSQIKFGIMMKGLNIMNYRGVAVGKEELLLGAQELYTQYANLSAEDGFNVPFLSANVTLFGTRDLGTPLQERVFQVGTRTVGVTAVAGNTTRKKLEDAGASRDPSELLVEDPREVLPAAIQRLRSANADLLVLLSNSDMEESKQLARDFPQFQIVVTSGSAEDPPLEPVFVGNTLIVQVGKKGKNATVVGVYPQNRLKMQILELDMDRFQNQPVMNRLMQEYQQQLRDAWPQLSAQSISDPPAGAFIGVQECKECHADAWEVWESSNHAHGYESLIRGRYGQEATWVSRIYDPECLCCHVTGWDPQRALRFKSGFVDMDRTPHLAGQQCENCHGPGSEHVSLEKAVAAGGPLSEAVIAARQQMQLPLERAKAVCYSCHDVDNSPNFDFDTYWPQIAH